MTPRMGRARSRARHFAGSFGRLFNRGSAEAEFAHLADQLEQVVLQVSLKSGLIERANSVATLMTGSGRSELEGRPLLSLIALPAFKDLPGLARSSPRSFQDVPMRTRAGRQMCLDIRVTSIGFGIEGRLLILGEDAGLRHNREQAAADRTQSLEALNALIALNVNPDEASLDHAVGLVRLYLQAPAVGLYSARPDQPGLTLASGVNLNTSFPDHIPPNEIEAFRTPQTWVHSRRADNCLSQAARFSGWSALLSYPVGEWPGQTGLLFVGYKNGQEGPPVSMLGIASQQVYLLQRQLVQQESLRRIAFSHQRLSSQLQSLLHQLREAVVILGPDRRVEYLNLAGGRLLGYKPEEAENLPFEDLLISSDGLHDVIVQALENGTPVENAQVNLHKRNGEPFPATVRVTPLRGEASPAGVMLVITDQSERLAFERRSQHLEQQAVLGELSSIFAHEVRNPINNISAVAQMAAQSLPADSPLRADLVTIRAEIERISRLLTDVLQFSRPLGLQIQPHSLSQLADRVLEGWSPRLHHSGITVRRDYDPATPPALLDLPSMERVLINLIDNALSAMPQGGTLTVMIRGTDTGADQPMVELKVSDTGLGMPEDVKARVFSPFFTTKSDGYGLGLSISRNIVQLVHRGAISVESFPGTGTIFTILLPSG